MSKGTVNGFLQLLPKISNNFGTALENAVFNALSMQQESVTYLKDTYEVDFYTAKVLYQVSYDISDEKTKKKENLATLDILKRAMKYVI